jgi:hypothetical protein
LVKRLTLKLRAISLRPTGLPMLAELPPSPPYLEIRHITRRLIDKLLAHEDAVIAGLGAASGLFIID